MQRCANKSLIMLYLMVIPGCSGFREVQNNDALKNEVVSVRARLESTNASDNAGQRQVTLSDATSAANCDGKAPGTIEQRLRYEKTSVPAGSFCLPELQLRVCSNGQWSTWTGSYLNEACQVEPQTTCDGKPNGSEESRTHYQSALVEYGKSCASEKQTRTCVNGQWSAWSGSFQHSVCAVGQPERCLVMDENEPENKSLTFNHGAVESRIYHKNDLVEFGEKCESETQQRVCDNGKMTPWSGSFLHSTCVVKKPIACTNPNIPHNGIGTRLRYKSSSVPYGSVCESEVQIASCFNGVATSFSGTFTAEKCEVQLPKSCDILGADGKPVRQIAHGQADSKIAYAEAEVAFGQECKFEVLPGVCNNGKLEYKTSAFTTPQTACKVRNALPCVDSRQNTVASGFTEAATKYETSQVKFGESCRQETRNRTCFNGVWSAWSGSYTNDSCSVAAPLSCGAVAHGVNESQIRYKASVVPAGSQCVSEVQTRTCTNGVFSSWTGSFAEQSCSVQQPIVAKGIMLNAGYYGWSGSYSETTATFDRVISIASVWQNLCSQTCFCGGSGSTIRLEGNCLGSTLSRRIFEFSSDLPTTVQLNLRGSAVHSYSPSLLWVSSDKTMVTSEGISCPAMPLTYNSWDQVYRCVLTPPSSNASWSKNLRY